MAVDIVLVEPEIPQNTGNIARTCVATGARLHLVEPLGFSIEDRQVKRAGLDYWYDLQLQVWPDLASCLDSLLQNRNQPTIHYVTTRGQRAHSQFTYAHDTILVFGKETAGLPQALLKAHPERCCRIPMLSGKRSLNLSNAVAIVLYEVLRQGNYDGLDVGKRSLRATEMEET